MDLQIAPVSFNDNLCVKKAVPFVTVGVQVLATLAPNRALTGNFAF